MIDNKERILRPVLKTSKEFWPFIGILTLISASAIYGYYTQLSEGMGVTGLNDITIWGLYITNFIFFIGISHAGIAISAGVRLLKFDAYKPIARLAELLTIVSLMMAGLNIIIDLGRPDRSYLLIANFLDRYGSSPLIWDITAVGTYLTLSTTYLYLPLRRDLKASIPYVDGWRKQLYHLLLPFYEEGEEVIIDRLTWWLGVTILPVMVMVHTTVAWIFSLLGARPLWFSAFAGPYYITAAVASGIASVIVFGTVLRKLHHWEDLIPAKLFRGMGNLVSIITITYLYMMVSEQITARFAGPAGEIIVSDLWLTGDFATMFWGMTVFGLFIPSVYLLVQAFRKDALNLNMTALMSAIIVIAFWAKRYIIIVPTMSIGIQKVGLYTPTWVEISILLGSFSIPILIYTILTKLIPIIEMEEHHHE